MKAREMKSIASKLPPTTHKRLQRAANKHGRSISAQIQVYLTQALKAEFARK